jgi:hypothetical protein
VDEGIEYSLLLIFGSLHSFGSNNVYSIFAAAVPLPWFVVVTWWTAAGNQHTLRSRLAPAIAAHSLSYGRGMGTKLDAGCEGLLTWKPRVPRDPSPDQRWCGSSCGSCMVNSSGY